LRFAQAEDWIVRQRLAEALGNLPTPKSISALQYLEKDSHPNVSAAASISLQRLATIDQEGS
jgi:HEAT repeat protein